MKGCFRQEHFQELIDFEYKNREDKKGNKKGILRMNFTQFS